MYKLKECRFVDAPDDEIRGTLGNSSDIAVQTLGWMIESKALEQVAVRIICLVSPLGPSVGASAPRQDSMKLYCPKWEHPP